MNKEIFFEEYKEIIRHGEEFKEILNNFMNRINDMTSEEKQLMLANLTSEEETELDDLDDEFFELSENLIHLLL